MAPRSALLAVAAVLGACGGAPTARDLAAEFDRARVTGEGGAPALFPGATSYRDEAGGDWLAVSAPATDRAFEPSPLPGVVHTQLDGLTLLAHRLPGDPEPRLTDRDGRPFRYRSWWSVDVRAGDNLRPGEFTFLGNELYVAADVERVLPLSLHVALRRSERESGRSRLVLGPLTADGFDLWPGEEWSFDVRGKGPWRLDFTFALLAYVEPPPGTPRSAEFVLRRDGEVVRDLVTMHPGSLEQPRWTPTSMVLEGPGRYTMSVACDWARTAILCPRLVPTGRSRPQQDDVAIFVADTFRADLVGSRSDAGPLTPHLDAFARSAVDFTQARSPSSWTLPSHTSLFTSLQPASHGVTKMEDRLGSDGLTLAERMRALGYRTVALTNGGFVARSYGLDRGFDLFFELRGHNEVEQLVDLVGPLLDVADERPLFLFFHTYRAHDPYRVDAETMASHAAALGIERDWDEISRVMAEAGWKYGGAQVVPDGLEREVRELRALYLAGASDVDRGFGRWLAMLDAAGRADVVVFTSDHGEAFGERDGRLGHHMALFEDQVRVPMLVRARGLAPAESRDPATLIDVAPTLLALLDRAPGPGWEGRALFDAQRRPRTPAAGVRLLSSPSDVAWIDGPRKVVAYGRGLAQRHVFDLAKDPWELRPEPAFADWGDARVAELLADDGWARPVLVNERAELSTDHAAQLRALGYTGDDDEPLVPPR